MIGLIGRLLVFLIVLSVLAGCSAFDYGAYTNRKVRLILPPDASQTSFVVRQDRQATDCPPGTFSNPKRNKEVLVLLALSGGGSRAAYFSALTMWEMQNLELLIDGYRTNLLHEVDVITSVSGGSLAAAYYAASHDPGRECAGHTSQQWTEEEIHRLMTLDFRRRWFLRWFFPNNIAAYWFTQFDRTDILSQVFSANLFDNKILEYDLPLQQLNPLRPNLILNATIGSADPLMGFGFGDVFTFTREDFARICSSVDDYSVARAVTATAAYPGMFNFMTLRNYCWDQQAVHGHERRYLHVFDGGIADNLGLSSIKRVIWTALETPEARPVLPYRKVIVILIDSHIDSPGVDPEKNDPRDHFDFIMDTNVMAATSVLMRANRDHILTEFEGEQPALFPFAPTTDGVISNKCAEFFNGSQDLQHYCDQSPAYWQELNAEVDDKLHFVHLTLDQVGDVSGCPERGTADPDCLRDHLNRIPTDFKLKWWYRHKGTDLTNAEALACGVPTLFGHVSQSCGGLTPGPSQTAPQKWQRVKDILEQPLTGVH